MSGAALCDFAKGMMFAMQVGSVSVPYQLLCYYRQLKLSDTDVMLLIQLMGFKQQEVKDFPTIEELQQRLATSPELVITSLQKLLKGNFISIDEEIDAQTGIQYERYNLSKLWEKIALLLTEQLQAERQRGPQVSPLLNLDQSDLFHMFEREFGRPLSPMECETITGWIDEDHYPEPLILLALKEAVFAGKVHFRYVDRILLEWNRNRIRSIEDAKAYTHKFRSNGR